ncbi:MAG: citrate lyase subunit beta / citryl-CoA lyase [Ilumatobacteraceae bacterium]
MGVLPGTGNRSWLFTPADDERKISRAIGAGSDAVIFDLEDAVTAEHRPKARAILAELLASRADGPSQRWVRINPLDTPDALSDLAAAVQPHLDGIVLPKIRAAADVTRLDHALSALEVRDGIDRGTIAIMVVATETPEMVFRLGDLAGTSDRLVACTWGAEDLSTALGATTNRRDDGEWDDPYRLARSLCLLAARAAGAQPVDTLFAAFRDDDGLTRSTRVARLQGFTGKVAIHPCQVAIINEGFTPSSEELSEAAAIVAAFADRAGAGAVSLDGRMLDRPHLLQAEQVLASARRFGPDPGSSVET